MNTQVVWPRYVLKFAVMENGSLKKDLDYQITTLALHPLPDKGDEVRFPENVTDDAGLATNVFSVLNRSFIYDASNAGTGLIYLKIIEARPS